ncbi:MAG: putative glycoside hydrolase, partial [Bacillota bacterium]|nr:putative glycoside hydrolase [Bacillota bacterium]
GNSAGLEKRFEELLNLVEATELNAMVIDIKNDDGQVTYASDIEIVREVGANKRPSIPDIEAVMDKLREKDIYPIGRLVVFRDPHLPEQRPQWAIQQKGGTGIWRDYKRFGWVNPYEKMVWDYNIAIAKEAALKGFREIQFDYVRFPENAAKVDREAEFPGKDGRTKDEAIEQFLTYAREQLQEYNVHISADVFGVISTAWGDQEQIGQNWEKVSPLVDVISPMIYPSHYGPGYFGFTVPDANPAGTVNRALADAVKRNAPLEDPAVIRPWLQSFTATWVKGYIPYRAREVRQQIDAARELGIDEFLIWNAANRYFQDAFLAANQVTEPGNDTQENGLDSLGTTAQMALENYLEAVKRGNWRDAYVLQSTEFSMDHDQYRAWFESRTGSLSNYEITERTEELPDKESFLLNLTLTNSAQELAEEQFEVILENGLWRIRASQRFLEALTEEPAADTESGESQ